MIKRKAGKPWQPVVVCGDVKVHSPSVSDVSLRGQEGIVFSSSLFHMSIVVIYKPILYTSRHHLT